MKTLRMKENRYSEILEDFEVLDKEQIYDIIENLNEEEIVRDLIGEVIVFEDINCRAFCEIDIRTGEIEKGWYMVGSAPLKPDVFITVASIESRDITYPCDISDEALLEEEELKELKELCEDMDYSEAYEIIKEKYNVDVEDRVFEYNVFCYMNIDCFNDYIYEDIENLYEKYEIKEEI